MEDTTTAGLLLLLGFILIGGPTVTLLQFRRRHVDRLGEWFFRTGALMIVAGWACVGYTFCIMFPGATYDIEMLQQLESSSGSQLWPDSPLLGASFLLMVTWFSTTAMAVGELAADRPVTVALAGTMVLAGGQIYALVVSYQGCLSYSIHTSPFFGNEAGVLARVVAVIACAYPAVVSALLGVLCIREAKSRGEPLAGSLPRFFWSTVVGILLGLSEAAANMKIKHDARHSVMMLKQPAAAYEYGQDGKIVAAAILFLLCMAWCAGVLQIYRSTRRWHPGPERCVDERKGARKEEEWPMEKEPLMEPGTGRLYGTWAIDGAFSSPLDLHMPV